FALTECSNLPYTTHLASCPSPNQPTISSDESILLPNWQPQTLCPDVEDSTEQGGSCRNLEFKFPIIGITRPRQTAGGRHVHNGCRLVSPRIHPSRSFKRLGTERQASDILPGSRTRVAIRATAASGCSDRQSDAKIAAAALPHYDTYLDCVKS